MLVRCVHVLVRYVHVLVRYVQVLVRYFTRFTFINFEKKNYKNSRVYLKSASFNSVIFIVWII